MFASACTQDLSLCQHLQSNPCAHTSEVVSGSTNDHAILPVNRSSESARAARPPRTLTRRPQSLSRRWTWWRNSQSGSSVAESCSPRRWRTARSTRCTSARPTWWQTRTPSTSSTRRGRATCTTSATSGRPGGLPRGGMGQGGPVQEQDQNQCPARQGQGLQGVINLKAA